MTPPPRVSIPADAPPRPCDEREAALLVRCHVREGEPPLIQLLPALPVDWPSGQVQGLHVVTPAGQVVIDLEWSHGRLARATFVADATVSVVVQAADNPPMTLTLPEGEPLTINQR